MSCSLRSICANKQTAQNKTKQFEKAHVDTEREKSHFLAMSYSMHLCFFSFTSKCLLFGFCFTTYAFFFLFFSFFLFISCYFFLYGGSAHAHHSIKCQTFVLKREMKKSNVFNFLFLCAEFFIFLLSIHFDFAFIFPQFTSLDDHMEEKSFAFSVFGTQQRAIARIQIFICSTSG